jgi:RHS repeat-associated protein
MAAVTIAAHADQLPPGATARSMTAARTSGSARGRAVVLSASGVTRGYTYNGRGDRTGESAGGASRALGYDQANRLVSVDKDISYAYNGGGLRMSKTVDGVATSFAWSEVEELPELLQDGDTSYIYGPEGVPIEQISAGTPVFLHQDQQGSTRLLTDAGGNAVGRYDYGPWGTVTRHAGAATTSLQFDGQYTDSETGYQYLRARYYDPTTGQFLTVDPALTATGGRYDFVANDPLNRADPLGLFSWSHAFKVAGLVAGGVAVAAAGCALTLCTADVVVAAGGIAAITSTAIDTGLALNDCAGHGDRNDCLSSSVGAGIGVVGFGAGKVAEWSFQGAARAINFGGSSISLGYDAVTYQGENVSDGAASLGGGGSSLCMPAPINIQGGSSTYLQPATGGYSLQ